MSIFVGRKTLQTRLRTWAQYAPVIEEHMHAAAEEARHDYFEYLYVHRDDGRRTVQLSAGNHPVSTNQDGSLQVEGGAALVLSQDNLFGHVAAFIYLYETDGKAKKPILWGVFDSPEDAAIGKWLNQAVLDFARCCRASSTVDLTAYRSDRIRMRWLQFRSRSLQVRGRLRFCTKLIRATRPWWQRIWVKMLAVIALLTFVTSLPSNLSTLSGYSLPSLWEKWHGSLVANGTSLPQQPVSPHVASAAQETPSGTKPQTKEPSLAPESNPMPIISGWYTFCPSDTSQANKKLLNFLYDVRAYAGKVVFFDVQVNIDCVLGKRPTYDEVFNRLEESSALGEVRYLFNVPLVKKGDLVTPRRWIDGERSPVIFYDMYSDNGSEIVMHNRNDSRNPLSHFQPHVEGSNDILFGPYSVKSSSDDAIITFDLDAVFLDSASLLQATTVANRLREGNPSPAVSPATK
ncbi:hypothetical protein [Herbaspirillum sp. RV1423]|uniref:hypothetical protein n=1 Tax=Herbaspirillum sp. RV1423 TaxID=1443993 RepID=UPI0004B424D8|nr:hypothetical protein [Herbaspirillum sp. RV1423]